MGKTEDVQIVSGEIERGRVSTRREVWAAIAFNLLAGFGWLLGAPARSMGHSNIPAREMFDWLPFYPLRFWGGVLVVFSLVLAVAVGIHSYSLFRFAIVALVAYWCWWAIVYALAVFTDNGSFVATALALGFARRHWVMAKVQPWVIKS